MTHENPRAPHRSRPELPAARKPIPPRLPEAVILHFKAEAATTGLPFRSLVELYLSDYCRVR